MGGKNVDKGFILTEIIDKFDKNRFDRGRRGEINRGKSANRQV
jgi:hypothetical protein